MYNISSSPTIINCTFTDNSATYDGGGMYNENYSSPTITNCTFTDNSAEGYGGGMSNRNNSNPTITNCTFAGNSATYSGGGISNYYNNSPTITNCTFTGNSADYGGGISFEHASNGIITNCILWGDNQSFWGEILYDYSIFPDVIVAYSNVQGGYPGTGNINADPQFVGSGDLHLQPGSPSIDTGNNTAVPTGVTTDLDGHLRIQNGTVDMGAYEWQANSSPIAQCKNVTVSACATCDVDASIDNGSYDPDAGDTVTLTQNPSGPYPLGTTLVTLTVTDSKEASSSCTANVIVVDDTPPTITPPPDLMLTTGAGCLTCGITVSDEQLGAATASDNCSDPMTHRSGVPAANVFPVGTTTITYWATDSSGNESAYVTQSVIVTDGTPPVITCPSPITVDGKLAQGGAIVTFLATATDNCDLSPTVVTSPVSGTLFTFGTHTVTATATDAAGNGSSCSFTVTVRTPQKQTDVLETQVQAIITSGVLTPTEGAGLIDKLNEIILKLDAGNTRAACNQLNAFIKQVNGFINDGSLTAEQGDELIDAANNIRTNIGC